MYYQMLWTRIKRNIWKSERRITLFNLDPEVGLAGDGIQLSFTLTLQPSAEHCFFRYWSNQFLVSWMSAKAWSYSGSTPVIKNNAIKFILKLYTYNANKGLQLSNSLHPLHAYVSSHCTCMPTSLATAHGTIYMKRHHTWFRQNDSFISGFVVIKCMLRETKQKKN